MTPVVASKAISKFMRATMPDQPPTTRLPDLLKSLELLMPVFPEVSGGGVAGRPVSPSMCCRPWCYCLSS